MEKIVDSYPKSVTEKNHLNNVNKILSTLNFFPKDICYNRVLDIACGTGISAEPYLGIAKELYLLDNNSEMLDSTLSLKSDKTMILRKKHNFLEGLPFPNNCFDVTQSVHGIFGYPKEDVFFDLTNEAKRVTKRGGKVLIVVDPTYYSHLTDVPMFVKDYSSSWKEILSKYIETSNIDDTLIVSLENVPEYLGIYFINNKC